jgi:heme exporter protein A
VLDEPFTALDSTGCTLLAQQMLIHADRGGIVIFTTHQPVQFPHNRVQLLNLELH